MRDIGRRYFAAGLDQREAINGSLDTENELSGGLKNCGKFAAVSGGSAAFALSDLNRYRSSGDCAVQQRQGQGWLRWQPSYPLR